MKIRLHIGVSPDVADCLQWEGRFTTATRIWRADDGTLVVNPILPQRRRIWNPGDSIEIEFYDKTED